MKMHDKQGSMACRAQAGPTKNSFFSFWFRNAFPVVLCTSKRKYLYVFSSQSVLYQSKAIWRTCAKMMISHCALHITFLLLAYSRNSNLHLCIGTSLRELFSSIHSSKKNSIFPGTPSWAGHFQGHHHEHSKPGFAAHWSGCSRHLHMSCRQLRRLRRKQSRTA